MKFWNYKGEQSCISDALRVNIPAHAVICLTGSGGKTSLLFAWARELASAGKSVAVTTTTHMVDPESDHQPCEGIRVIYTDSYTDASDEDSQIFADLGSALESDRIVMAVSHDAKRPGKVMSPSEGIIEFLHRNADVVLIEADGSRRMPLKWPAPWEPVVPEYTDITVCLAGLSSLGKAPQDVIYRYDDMPEELRRDKVDELLICTMLASLEGGQKGAQGEFRVFFNQADTDELRQSSARMQQILGLYGIQSAWGTLYQE